MTVITPLDYLHAVKKDEEEGFREANLVKLLRMYVCMYTYIT